MDAAADAGGHGLAGSFQRIVQASRAAAQAKGRERYEGFVEALGRRLAKGQTLAQEISQDVISKDTTPDHTDGAS